MGGRGRAGSPRLHLSEPGSVLGGGRGSATLHTWPGGASARLREAGTRAKSVGQGEQNREEAERKCGGHRWQGPRSLAHVGPVGQKPSAASGRPRRRNGGWPRPITAAVPLGQPLLTRACRGLGCPCSVAHLPWTPLLPRRPTPSHPK